MKTGKIEEEEEEVEIGTPALKAAMCFRYFSVFNDRNCAFSGFLKIRF
ncbi:MAG: hypothetical protein HC817_01875 [Saprospiraceae bacterium]|nr:hypothetical protein [Saprospiraceae bacterium]